MLAKAQNIMIDTTGMKISEVNLIISKISRIECGWIMPKI